MCAIGGRGEVMRTVYLLGLLAFLSVVACQTAEVSPTPSTTTAEPTHPPLVIEMGQTAEGAFYQGSPDAPVKLYDFSNFL